MEPKKTAKEVNRSETQKNRVNWQISGRSTAAHMPVDRKTCTMQGLRKLSGRSTGPSLAVDRIVISGFPVSFWILF